MKHWLVTRLEPLIFKTVGGDATNSAMLPLLALWLLWLLCRNDIGREWIDNNYMIYLPLHIVTHDVYSTTHELTS
jgi:hypothetical protein